MLSLDQTALIVVDFQEKLLPKIFNAQAIVPQAIKLIRFARELDIPLLVTEQYPKGLGATVPELVEELGGKLPLTKTSFGCFGADGFVAALRNLGRTQLLITGIEAHVCVMQTVLAALENGYGVFVVKDATGSRNISDFEAGLARMSRHGAELVTTEMAMFEILRDAAKPEFKKVLPLLK